MPLGGFTPTRMTPATGTVNLPSSSLTRAPTDSVRRPDRTTRTTASTFGSRSKTSLAASKGAESMMTISAIVRLSVSN